MNLRDNLNIGGYASINIIDNAESTNFSALFEKNGLVTKRTLGNIVNYNYNDVLSSISYNLPSIFTAGSIITPTNAKIAFSLTSQSIGTFFAAPDIGNGTPSFRRITANDLSDTGVLFTEVDPFGVSDIAFTGTTTKTLTITLNNGQTRIATFEDLVTSYPPGTLELLKSGTDTLDRIWSAKVISDYVKALFSDTSATDHTHTFASITDKPTTVVGYGITDAMTTAHPANVITTTNITNWDTSYNRSITAVSVTGTTTKTITLTKQDGTKLTATFNDLNDNIVYTAGDLTLLKAGTDTTNSVWSAKTLADYVVSRTTFVEGVGITISKSSNDDITISAKIGTTANTLAAGNDSRFHNKVTIGTSSNGLSLSDQVLSLSNATTTTGGAMSANDKVKLDSLSNYSLATATSTILGGVKLFSDTVQTVVSNAVSASASRTYGIQNNTTGQLVVNVPWINTTYTAGNGLTLAGTEFTLPVVTSGTGNAVASITQTATGITQTMGNFSLSTHTHAFNELTNKPTTLSGYGITDAGISEVVTNSAIGLTDVASTINGSTFLNFLQGGVLKGSVKIIGSGATSVTHALGGIITISSTDTNTTYTAGDGLTLTGTAFSLPVVTSGTGNAVVSITQTATGITQTMGSFLPLSGGTLTGPLTVTGFVTATSGYKISGKTDTSVVLAGGGTKNLSDFIDVDLLGQIPNKPISLPTNTDLNTITTPSFNVQLMTSNATTALNYPEAISGVLEVFKSANGGIIQIYTTYAYNRRYIRNLYSNVWSAWTKVLTDSDITLGMISNWNTAYGWGDYRQFGLGAPSPVTLTTLTANNFNGLYSLVSNATDAPIVGSSGSVLHMKSGASGYWSQMFLQGSSGTTTRAFISSGQNTTRIAAWQELYHTGNLTTLKTDIGLDNYYPKSGGDLNGAVNFTNVNYGINVNGKNILRNNNVSTIISGTNDTTGMVYIRPLGDSNNIGYQFLSSGFKKEKATDIMDIGTVGIPFNDTYSEIFNVGTALINGNKTSGTYKSRTYGALSISSTASNVANLDIELGGIGVNRQCFIEVRVSSGNGVQGVIKYLSAFNFTNTNTFATIKDDYQITGDLNTRIAVGRFEKLSDTSIRLPIVAHASTTTVTVEFDLYSTSVNSSNISVNFTTAVDAIRTLSKQFSSSDRLIITNNADDKNLLAWSEMLNISGYSLATGYKINGKTDTSVILAGGGSKLLSEIMADGKFLPLTGGTLTGNLVVNARLVNNNNKSSFGYTSTNGFQGFPNTNVNDNDNYITRAISEFTTNNNGLYIFGDGTTNSRRMAIQSGHYATNYATTYGILELNPYGGEVRTNGKKVVDYSQFTSSRNYFIGNRYGTYFSDNNGSINPTTRTYDAVEKCYYIVKETGQAGESISLYNTILISGDSRVSTEFNNQLPFTWSMLVKSEVDVDVFLSSTATVFKLKAGVWQRVWGSNTATRFSGFSVPTPTRDKKIWYKDFAITHGDVASDYSTSEELIIKQFGDYLPLTGGTISNSTATPLEIRRTIPGNLNILFNNVGNNYSKYLGFDANGILKVGDEPDLGGNKGATILTSTLHSDWVLSLKGGKMNDSANIKWGTPSANQSSVFATHQANNVYGYGMWIANNLDYDGTKFTQPRGSGITTYALTVNNHKAFSFNYANSNGTNGGDIALTEIANISANGITTLNHGTSANWKQAYDSLGNFVNKSGDTMTGALTIKPSNSSSVIEQDVLILHDLGTASGNVIPISFQYGTSTSPTAFMKVVGKGISGASGATFQFWDNASMHSIIDSTGITANKFIKSGGTASQFLKADGSIDSNSYFLASNANNLMQNLNNSSENSKPYHQVERGFQWINGSVTNFGQLSSATGSFMSFGNSGHKGQLLVSKGDMKFRGVYGDADNSNWNTLIHDGNISNFVNSIGLGRNRIQQSTALGAGDITFVHTLMGAGFSIYDDPEFNTGLNGIAVYNSTYATVERIDDDQLSANSSGKIIRVKNTTGGNVGFFQSIISRANATFAQIFRAKIPIGYKVDLYENTTGIGSQSGWLTSQEGTGKWEWYVRYNISGNSGSFSSAGHVGLNASSGTGISAENPITWYLSYCNAFDLTSNQNVVIQAKKLYQARKINNVDFDGTKDISIDNLVGTSYSTLDLNTVPKVNNVLTYYPKIMQGSPNLFPNSNNANAMLHIAKHNVDHWHQLGFSSNGNMYHRNNNGTWFKILDEDNISTLSLYKAGSHLKLTGTTFSLEPTINTWINDSAGNTRMYFSPTAVGNDFILKLSQDLGQFNFRDRDNSTIAYIDKTKTVFNYNLSTSTTLLEIIGRETNKVSFINYNGGTEIISNGLEHTWYNNIWKHGLRRGGSSDSMGYSWEFNKIEVARIGNTGIPLFKGLSGTGTRMVVVNSAGELGTDIANIDYVLGAGNTTGKNIEFTGEGSILSTANATRLNLLVHQKYTTAVSTGILTIKHAPLNSATMFDMTVKVYGYQSRYLGEYRISFYQFNNTNISASGHNGYVTSTGNLPSTRARVGFDASGNISLMIGDTTTDWSSYLSYSLERVETKHSGYNQSHWVNGWTSEMVVDTTGYTSIVEIPVVDVTHTHNNKAFLDTINQNLGTTHSPTFSNVTANDFIGRATNIGLNSSNVVNANYGHYGGLIQDSTNGPVSGQWSNRLKILHNNSVGYFTELAQSFTGDNGLYYRRMVAGTLSDWEKVATEKYVNSKTAASYINKNLTPRATFINLVIPLFEYLEPAQVGLNTYFSGSLFMSRTNGLNGMRDYVKVTGGNTWNNKADVTFETSGADNIINLVSFTYGGKKYIGIRVTQGAEYEYYSVEGSSTNPEIIETIPYSNSNTNAVLNAEINNSISLHPYTGKIIRFNNAITTSEKITAKNIQFNNHTTSSPGIVSATSMISNMGGDYGYGISTNQNGGLDIMANQNSQPIRLWSGQANATPYKTMELNGSGVYVYGTIITTNFGNSDHWWQAYSWGNHALSGYTKQANNGANINSVRVLDTRSSNPLPNTNLTNGVWFDFKQNSAIGLTLSGTGTYSSVMTMVPYQDASGNNNVGFRLAHTNNRMYFQMANGNAWSTWNHLMDSTHVAYGITQTNINTWNNAHSHSNKAYLDSINQNLGTVNTVQFGSIELSAATPFIDFHYGRDNTDYSSRIIEDTSGGLSIITEDSFKYKLNGISTPFLNINRYSATLGVSGVTMFEAVYLKTVFGSLDFDDEGLNYRPNDKNYGFGISANVNAYYDMYLAGKLNNLKILGKGSFGLTDILNTNGGLNANVFGSNISREGIATFRSETTLGGGIIQQYGTSLIVQSLDTMFTISANPFYDTVYISAGSNTTNTAWNRRLAFTENSVQISAPSFRNSSLRKLKENFRPIEQSGLDLVNGLEILKFDRKDTQEKNIIGIIADDTNEEFLSPEKDAVDLYKTIFIQAKAIQELSEKIEQLEKIINKIKS